MNLNELTEAEILMVLYNSAICVDFDEYDSESIDLSDSELILTNLHERGEDWNFTIYKGRKLNIDLNNHDSNDICFKRYNSANGSGTAERELKMYYDSLNLNY